MKKMKFILATFLLLLLLGACSDNEEAAPKEEAPEPAEEMTTELDLPAADEVVAVVNGEEIVGNIYNSVARQMEASLVEQGEKVTDEENAEQVKSQAISVIVGNKLIIQEAAEKGIKPDEALLDERIEELKGQFEDEEAMDKALERTGFTMDDLKGQLRDSIVYENYVAEEVETPEVTDEEVQKAYDSFASVSEEEAPAFEEVEPSIRQTLEQQKTQEAVYNHIEKLKEKADIEVKI